MSIVALQDTIQPYHLNRVLFGYGVLRELYVPLDHHFSKTARGNGLVYLYQLLVPSCER